ncbi:hypothetical protein L1987_07769 [Smallanthus sonchifolius]|uniref:Uncharacterized protein n=1 Tax=Smallanthus sonchifolius TaxID=185202 RepID=A0ACB9JKI9_9ASTR|nr:hypothetical protein L1987_07769 [Smallanthus sonchifolius]
MFLSASASFPFTIHLHSQQIEKKMAKSVSRGAILSIMSNPNPDSSVDLPEIVVQVLDIKFVGNRYTPFSTAVSQSIDYLMRIRQTHQTQALFLSYCLVTRLIEIAELGRDMRWRNEEDVMQTKVAGDGVAVAIGRSSVRAGRSRRLLPLSPVFSLKLLRASSLLGIKW